jgi:hypothetical protein
MPWPLSSKSLLYATYHHPIRRHTTTTVETVSLNNQKTSFYLSTEDGSLLECSAIQSCKYRTHLPDDGVSKLLWNVGQFPQHYTAFREKFRPHQSIHWSVKYLYWLTWLRFPWSSSESSEHRPPLLLPSKTLIIKQSWSSLYINRHYKRWTFSAFEFVIQSRTTNKVSCACLLWSAWHGNAELPQCVLCINRLKGTCWLHCI